MSARTTWVPKVTVLVLVLAARAGATPYDSFTGSTRAWDSKAPEARKAAEGEWGVSEQVGAATYTYGIVVPPGRNGMQPALALRYSSQSPRRGGLADGWTLDVPTIRLEPGQRGGPDRYVTTLGAGGTLVPVNDLPVSDPSAEMYRPEFADASFARFEYLDDVDGVGEWRVYTVDGVERRFRSLVTDERWFLMTETDSYDNTVEYYWSTEFLGLEDDTPETQEAYTAVLDRIEYSSNPALGLPAHARVLFDYGPAVRCGGQLALPIGGALEAFGGELYIAGALPLQAISTGVRNTPAGAWRPVRTITLGYGESCGVTASPVRELVSIHESAVSPTGAYTEMPTVTFEYGVQERLFDVVETPPSEAHAYRGIRQRGNTSTLLDMDGDGILDLVTSGTQGGDGRTHCALRWQKGVYGGGYEEDANTFLLPTATWRGGTEPGGGEWCSLSGQVTHHWNTLIGPGGCPNRGALISYHLMDVDGDALVDLLVNIWTPYFYDPALDPDFVVGAAAADECPDGTEDTGTTTTTDGDGTVHNTHHCECPSGTQIYTGNGHASCCENGFNVETGECATGGGDPGDPGGGEDPPEGGGGSSGGDTHCEDLMDRAPEIDGVQGRYLWRVYKNTGSGFDSAPSDPGLDPDYWFSPVPLPPNSTESLYATQLPWAMLPTLVDLDADGYLDVVDLDGPMDIQQLGGTDWTMYRGRGDGDFTDLSTLQTWTVPAFTPHGSGTGWVPDTPAAPPDPTGMIPLYLRLINADLIDVNGDRLPDLVAREEADNQVVAFLNTGSGFRGERILLGSTTALESTFTQQTSEGPGGTIGSGDRWHARRVLDVDEDGLADLVDLGDHTVQFNHGSGFLPPRLLDAVVSKANRNLNMDVADWQLTQDLVDATGDGVADIAEWSEAGLVTVHTDDVTTAPRLLRRVNNGRGLTVDFSYLPSTDPDAVTWTSSDAHLPHVVWVVRSVTTKASATAPPSQTTYHYQDPVYGAETGHQDGRPRFLGFSAVTTDQPAPEGAALGGRVVRAYDYDVVSGTTVIPRDRRGHVATVTTYNRNATTSALEMASFRVTTWAVEGLFAGWIAFSHPTVTRSRLCSPEIVDCADFASSTNVVREEETWERWNAPNGPVALYLRTGVLRSASSSAPDVVGDRQVVAAHEVRYASISDGDDYRVLTILEQAEELSVYGSTTLWLTKGRTETTYDSAGLPIRTDAWLDEATFATTLRSFDGAGNLLTVIKPEQIYDPSPPLSPKTIITYDEHRVHPVSTINELGHIAFDFFDVGTGAETLRIGPNKADRIQQCGTGGCLCSMNPTCTVKVWDIETWIIDGFGRVTEHRVSVDHPTLGYLQQAVDRFTYVDLAIPNQVTEQHLKDYGGAEWLTTTRELDGAGRVTKEIQPLAILPDAESTFHYDTAGNLTTVLVPDPRTDTGATVGFTMSHDALGRTTRFTRPDGAVVTIDYTGLDTTVTEQATDGSGGVTRQRNDVFGRLIEVTEGLGTVDAVTHYYYDANDNLRQVNDADANATLLTHDWLDHRTSIQRGTRVWRYAYDRNGNLVSETSPAPPGEEAAYTTTFEYDDLDRIKRKDPAVRDLDEVRREKLGIGPVVYTYDTATVPNSIGRLSRVDLYPRTTELPAWGTVKYEYQAQGLVSEEERTFSVNYLSSLPPTTQRVNRVYNALGNLTLSIWNDMGDTWRTVYDERGLAQSVDWNLPGTSTWQSVATYTRSLAGAPRMRTSDAAFGGQQRTYAYDAIGRVIGDTISAMPGGVPSVPALRTYQYTQSGDLGQVTGHNLSTAVDATFTFDPLHRLLTAAGPGPYNGAFTYSKSGNILSAHVSLTGAAEVAPRDVTYDYGAVDPQAVDSLESVGGGTWASFTYDLSGNTIERNVPGGMYTLTWDGEDQVREVEGPSGTEAYYYDHTGQRVLAVSAEGVKWWFGEVEHHLEPSGGISVRRYLHLADSGGPLARVEFGPGGSFTAIELQYADTLGNLMLSLDSAGNAVANFAYSPFGEVIGSSGAATHRRQFNGKEHDAVSGLRYYGFRYYDPITLRWTSSDPLFRFAPDVSLARVQEQNLYSFSLNNPLRYLDPDGEKVRELVVGLGFGVMQGFTPGGFLLPSPAPWSRDFETGRGIGQMAAGALQLALVRAGTSAAEVLAGRLGGPIAAAAVEIVAAPAVAHAASSVAAGGITLINASKLSPDSPLGAQTEAKGGGRIGRKWAARDVASCERGCEKAAREIQKHIGGDIHTITPKDAPSLGGFRGKNWGWSHHEVVVKDGRVFDATTGHEGLPISDYKKLWQYADEINFGF